MPSLRPQTVSRTLRAAGHGLVFPDRKRDGVSVQTWDQDHVVIRFSYTTPQLDIAQIMAEVISTLVTNQYLVTHLECSTSKLYGLVVVTRKPYTLPCFQSSNCILSNGHKGKCQLDYGD